MAQLPSAFACHLSSVDSSELPLACTAKSMIVVVPPQAAARVPVSNVSAENVPPHGISMCVCASMPPGSTYLPVASMTRSAGGAQAPAGAWPPGWERSRSGELSLVIRAAIVSPSTSTSAGIVPVAVTTVPPLIRMRMTAPWLRLNERGVAVGPPVAVERPEVADLGEQAHVQVADHHLVLGVGGRVADQLAAGVGEVGLAVEVVVAERLGAHPVDRADEVLVRDRRGGLLEPPEVLGQAAAGRGGIEHDAGAAQAERAPALGEVPLVADVHADLAHRGVEYRVAEVARAEVELLPEPSDLGDVVLAVLAQVAAVGVDHRGGVVVDAGLLLLVNRHHQHHPGGPGERDHPLDRPALRYLLRQPVVLGVLDLAEIRSGEDLLKAQHLRPLASRPLRSARRVVDHRANLAGPLGLHQRRPHHLRHGHLLASGQLLGRDSGSIG